jgi:beta-carotene 3-hydroxylase
MVTGLLIVGATLVVMEGVAWAMHKYVLHGFLWFLHRSHHTRHSQVFELNDLFFTFYGTLATVFFIYGSAGLDYRFWVAVGISVYGLLYFLVHDIYIHRRLRLFRKTSNVYLKALNIAHKVHHRNTGKAGGEAFGMLLVGKKYFETARRAGKRKQNIRGAILH